MLAIVGSWEGSAEGWASLSIEALVLASSGWEGLIGWARAVGHGIHVLGTANW